MFFFSKKKECNCPNTFNMAHIFTHRKSSPCTKRANESVTGAGSILACSQIIQLYNSVKPLQTGANKSVGMDALVCACALYTCVLFFFHVRWQCIHVLQAPWVTSGLLINHSIHCLSMHRTGLEMFPLCLFYTGGWLMLSNSPITATKLPTPTLTHLVHTCSHNNSASVCVSSLHPGLQCVN